jgi:hypothetical protein
MDVIATGPANPHAGARLFAAERTSVALLAMAAAGNQRVSGERGHNSPTQFTTGWLGRQARGVSHAVGVSDSQGKKGRTRLSGQKPPKEDVQQAEEKQKYLLHKNILTKKFQKT